jgi:hypothetical protein
MRTLSALLSRALFSTAFMTPTLIAQTGVSGQVINANTLQPIPNAKVTWQATTETTISANDGSFHLPGAIGNNLVIVGAMRDYYYGSATVSSPATGVTLALEPLGHVNDPTYSFLEPAECSICHPTQYEQWAGSPMAKAGGNTWVYDIYDGTGSAGGMGGFVYTRDSIHAASQPNSECASCHQPEPWVKRPFKALDPITNLSNGSVHGISCEVCHKIADVDETKPNYPGIWPGIVQFDLPASPTINHQVTYGVLGDVSYESPQQMRPSYNPELVAETCAACHQDKNDPDGDGLFEEANGIISEPTYLEWTASTYSDPQSPNYASCVDCHMPSYGGTEACQTPGYTSPVRDPNTIRSHSIVGTTPEFLENAVEMFVDTQRDATGLDVQVEVRNSLTGHAVPTGVTVRNVVLVLDVVRSSDGQVLSHLGSQTVHALGGVGNPAQGYYAGLPGKIYAKHNEDALGQGPTFYTDAAAIRWDTRIHAETSDLTNYRFACPPGTGEVEVRARLIYRRAFRFLVDAKQWTRDGHGNPLEDVQAPHFGHLMEEVVAHSQEVGPGSSYCSSTSNSTGNTARMSASGSSSITSNDLVLVASNLPDPAYGVFYLGTAPASTPLFDGTLCVSGTTGRFPVIGPSAGSVVSQPVDNQNLPGGLQVQSGTTLYFQYWFRDRDSVGIQVNLTDGYQVTFVP